MPALRFSLSFCAMLWTWVMGLPSLNPLELSVERKKMGSSAVAMRMIFKR